MTHADHPLDRPVWTALTTRQAPLAVGDGRALRFRPSVNLFGAAADHAPESLAALGEMVPAEGTLGLVEAAPHPPVPGTTIVSAREIDQMVLTRLERSARPVEIVPGPFFADTWRQGGYIGVREQGRLVAMAGQRMKPPGFTEVSAVCTHPDFQGRGLARALMEAAIAAVIERGEASFLHCYPDNPARVLYESLGFRTRATMTYTLLSRDNAFSR